VLDEFYKIAFRRKIYNSLDQLQADPDTWLKHYDEECARSSKYCCWENTNASVSGFDAVSQRENTKQQRTASGCLIVRLSPIHYP
jgi:hypothetical protein